MVENMTAGIARPEETLRIYSITEAAKELGVSRSWVYYLIHTKRIKARKIGVQYTISQTEIARYRDGHNNK